MFCDSSKWFFQFFWSKSMPSPSIRPIFREPHSKNDDDTTAPALMPLLLVRSLKERQWWMAIMPWILWVIRPWQPQYFFCSETFISLWPCVNFCCVWSDAWRNGRYPAVSAFISHLPGRSFPASDARGWRVAALLHHHCVTSAGGSGDGAWGCAPSTAPHTPHFFTGFFWWICSSKHQVSPLSWATASKRGLPPKIPLQKIKIKVVLPIASNLPVARLSAWGREGTYGPIRS